MSLRTRVLVGMAAIAVVLVAVAAIVLRVTSSYLVDRLDDQLRAAARPSRGYFGDGPLDERAMGAGRPGSALYVGVIRNGVLYRLQRPGFDDTDVALPDISIDEAVAAAEQRPPEPFTVRAVDGRERFRALAEPGVRPSDTIVLALSMADVDAARQRLLVVLGGGTALALGVLGLVTWWVIRLGVRPIKDMTATATAIAAGDLSQRVEPGAPGTEAGELAGALNTMLARIQDSFTARDRSEERLRQFVADASHELRTPVTSIRGYAELYRRGALEGPDLDQAMRRTEQEAVRMGRLIDDLLLLARLDQGRPLEREPVELTSLVDDAVLDARAVAPERTISAELAPGVIVRGDRHRLHQVVANLLTNALRHTPGSAPIDVRLQMTDGRAVLEVRDGGPGMPPEVAARAFERFYRADPSRARDRGGSGLGLSIVQAIVASHGGTVRLDSAPGQGTVVRVELPAEAPLPPPQVDQVVQASSQRS